MAVDSSTIIYTGYNLTNIGVNSNSSVESALQSINTTIGTFTGINWGSFNYHCIPGSITTAQQFAEGVTSYICSLNADYQNFKTVTYPASISSLESSINAISEPSLSSCSFIGIQTSDNIQQVLGKTISSICTLQTNQNPSNAQWNTYFAVNPFPTTITDGFNVLINQIGLLKNSIVSTALPLFDNTNTCLATPTTTDTLYNTIIKIRTLLCSLPTLNINDLSWTTCITNPNIGGGADLTSTLNQILSKLDLAYTKRVNIFDPTYFTVSNTTTGNTCSGQNVTLNTDLGFSDKMVSLTGSDSPDYLLNKIVAGSNISFDTATTTGKVIINGTSSLYKLKAFNSDPTADFLINKISGKSDDLTTIQLNTSSNSVTNTVDITPVINWSSFATKLMDVISQDDLLSAQFCALACSCNPCTTTTTTTASPSNISAILRNSSVTSNNVLFNASFSQNSPTVSWYTSGNLTLPQSASITTGNFSITASTPVQGILTITNNDTGTLNYHVYVLDNSGATVSGSSTYSGNVSTGTTFTSSPFTYGTSINGYILHIDISK